MPGCRRGVKRCTSFVPAQTGLRNRREAPRMRFDPRVIVAIFAVVLSSPAFAQQVPAPKTPAEVIAPADGISMSPAYARAVAQTAYIWGWPMVNMLNRSATITKAPHPGLLNGVLPV